jgi:hypothetical protein
MERFNWQPIIAVQGRISFAKWNAFMSAYGAHILMKGINFPI